MEATIRRSTLQAIIPVTPWHKYLHNMTKIQQHTNNNRPSSNSSYTHRMYMRLWNYHSTWFGQIQWANKNGTSQNIQNTKLQQSKYLKMSSDNTTMIIFIALSSNLTLLLELHKEHMLEGVHHKYLYTLNHDDRHQMHQKECIYRQSHIANMFTHKVLSFSQIGSSVAPVDRVVDLGSGLAK